MFNPTNSSAIISISKTIFWIFFSVSGTYLKFWIISKKSWASELIFYWNYKLETADLLKSTKNRISQDFLTVNMLKGPKHCLNLHGSVFVIFFDLLSKKISPINALFEASEILRLFFSIVTPYNKYILSVKASV